MSAYSSRPLALSNRNGVSLNWEPFGAPERRCSYTSPTRQSMNPLYRHSSVAIYGLRMPEISFKVSETDTRRVHGIPNGYCVNLGRMTIRVIFGQIQEFD